MLEAILLHAAGPRAAQLMLTALRPHRSPGVGGLDLSRYSTPWETIFLDNDVRRSVRLSAIIDDRRFDVSFIVPRTEQPSTLSSSSTGTATSVPVASDTPYSYSLQITVGSWARGSGKLQRRRFIQTISPQPLGPAIAGLGSVQQQVNISLDLKPQANSGPVALAFYISPQTRSPQNELAQRYSGLRIHNGQQLFLDTMRAIEPSIEHVEVLASTNVPLLYLTMAGSPPLPISVLGEGVNAVANYVTAILEAANGTVLIDEIENGIHYSVLESLWRQIGRSVRENNSQVVASTHSAECVDAAYQAFRDTPHMLRVLRLKPGKQSPAAETVADYDMEALEGAIEQNLEIR